MSMMNQIMKEVIRRQKETGKDPTVIQLNPVTKAQWESEMKERASFLGAVAKGRDMVINRIFEPLVDGPFKGHPKPDGWEIPVEARNEVPMGQIWVGVDGYDISRSQIGRKIPRHLLKGATFDRSI
jgi:hypothetical protein